MITPYQCSSLSLGNPVLAGGGIDSLPVVAALGSGLGGATRGKSLFIMLVKITFIDLRDELSQQEVSLFLYWRKQELRLNLSLSDHNP